MDMNYNCLNTDNISLCVLPTQFGKTFIAITQIKNQLKNDQYDGRSIHFVNTMNDLLNNEQFANRLNEIEEQYGKGTVCIFSSKYKGKYNHVKTVIELQGICFDETTCPRIVVMCSHYKRFDDGVKFMNVINNNYSFIKRAFCYYDELHNYISKKLYNQIENINKLNIVKKITALSATPEKLWKYWSDINMIDLECYNDDNYVMTDDMIYICEEPDESINCKNYTDKSNNTIKFARYILKKYPEVLCSGNRIFIPAHVLKDSHFKMRDLIFTMNIDCVVILLNSDEKSLTYIENGIRKTIPILNRNQEVCDTISEKLEEFDLYNRPIVFTGFLCVSMGQTLTNSKLGSFTDCILSHVDLNDDDIYQLFGRITGRMKNWDTYYRTHVYCPSVIMRRVHMMEDCAISLAKEYNGCPVTHENYLEPVHNIPEYSNTKRLKVKKKGHPDKRQTIPVVVQLHKRYLDAFKEIPKGKHNKKYKFIMKVLKRNSNEFYRSIIDYDCFQITMPKADNSYKKHILNLVKASQNNKPTDIDVIKKSDSPKYNADKSFFNCYVDDRENRFVFMVWNGAMSE